MMIMMMMLGSVSAIRQIRVTESPKSILSRRLKHYNNYQHGGEQQQQPMMIPRGGSTEEDDAAVDDGAVPAQVEEEHDTSQDSNQLVQEEATALRQKGKELHDQGDLLEAATVFAQAGNVLLSSSSQEEDDDAPPLLYLEDYCTCRLHEALCRLKLQDYDDCIAVCTFILQLDDTTAAIRARAHHRRAKAYLGLVDDDNNNNKHEEEALQDARAAAFLGDRKAVALYGKLMRGNTANEAADDSVASPPMLNDLLQGKNPFLPTSSSSDASSDASSLLLQSLMGKSNPNPLGSSSSSATSPLGDIPSLLGQGGAGGTLAKSLLSSLAKRLETDSDSICNYLHKTNPMQIQQLGGMAGLPISASQAKRLSSFCHAVTPKAIRRTVRYSKRALKVVTILRKVLKVLSKYKHILILWALAAWIQAAIRRPIPISKQARKQLAAIAATTAASAATGRK